jgi:DNA-binding SARP family transcriptional activator
MSRPPGLFLQYFGPPQARSHGQVLALGQKPLALLLYLDLSPDGRRSRSHLRGLLWPDIPEARARHSLNEAASRLRKALGAGCLGADGDALVLSREGCDSDVRQFTDDPAAGVALAQADFLEGFALPDAPQFEEWAEAQRARYRGQLVAAILKNGEQRLAQGQYLTAADLAETALSRSPYNETAIGLAMRASALGGDASGALARCARFTDRLVRDLGEAPSQELTALAERIRAGLEPGDTEAVHPRVPALVGRESLHTAIFTLLAAPERGPRLLIITGDSGSGRSRLLSECLERLRLGVGTAYTARLLPGDGEAPLAALRFLLRNGLLDAPGAMAIDPAALELLRRFVHAVPAVIEAETGSIGAALEELLTAVADEGPVVLALDNADLADRSTLQVLSAALLRAEAIPLSLILTTEGRNALIPSELQRLQAEIGRGLSGLVVELPPLTAGELATLVDQLATWCAWDQDRERLTRRMMLETGGNAFLAVTLLTALQSAAALREEALQWPPAGGTTESPLPISLPGLIRRVINARVSALEPETRRVLQCAAVGSLRIRVPVVAALGGFPEADVLHQLAELERLGFVVFLEGDYRFAAPLLAEMVRTEWLLPGERHALRQKYDQLSPL